MSSVQELKSLLKKHNIRPTKHFGQIFLVDRNVLGKIIQAADLSANDTVIEVGPGMGILTLELARRAKKVIAVEKDPGMVEILREVTSGASNIEIVNADILKWNIGDLKSSSKEDFKVVANIPYYITSPIIRMFLESKLSIPLMVIMVQKEVARRVCSLPPDMSILAVATQFYSKPKIAAYVSKGSFWPVPEVDSAILRIEKNTQYYKMIVKEDIKLFFEIVRSGFAHKRKLLLGNLSDYFDMPKPNLEAIFSRAGLSIAIRAQELSIGQWITLLQEIKKEDIM